MIATRLLDEESMTLTKAELLAEAQMHHKELLLYAISCCGDYSEAQEMVGDLYLEIEQEKLRYTLRGATAKTFLCAVLHNKSRNFLRKLGRRASRYLVGLFSSESPSPEALVSKKEELVWLRRSIQALPPRMQEVLRLRYLQGLSVKECQEAMGVNSPGTISEQERRGLERLRALATKDQLR
jgi:RNA polymerase sigma factor (sigma-70 family)